MKVYLDFVFLLNFFFDFLILYATKKVLKICISFKRLLLGSLVASGTIIFLFLTLNTVTLFLLKIIMSIFIILVTFGKKNFFKNICYFYLISIILGGTLYLLNISISYKNQGILFINNGLALNFIIILLVAPILIFSYIKEQISYKNIYSNIYEVKIYINNKAYNLKGLLDTGNMLEDPYKKRPIIIINKNIKIAKSKFLYVPYEALNTKGIIKCYTIDKVIINNTVFKNCLIGISNDELKLNGTDCILPNKFKEEL